MSQPAVAARIQLVSVRGTPFERGKALGVALAAQIASFLAEGVARLEWVMGRPIEGAQLSASIAAHAAVIERETPDLAEEIHGLSCGAGIPLTDAYLLQMRRELLAGVAADCTTMARGGPGGFLAQTVDLPGRLADVAVAVRSESAAGASLQLTFAGLLGYLGVNDRGLAVGINMVQSGGWRPGIPPYLIVRRLLEMDSLDACVDEIARLTRASSRCYTIVDRNSAVQVETTCDAVDVAAMPTVVHTNHYLSPALAPLDRSHVMHRRESRRRRERALAELSRIDDAALDALAPEQLFDALSAHGDAPICLHGNGDPRRSETVAAVVVRPADRELHVRRGHPCQSATDVFTLPERGQS